MNDAAASRLQHILGTIVNKNTLSGSELHWLSYVAGRGIEPATGIDKEEFGVRFAPDPYIHGRTSSKELAQQLGEAFYEGDFDIMKRHISTWEKVN